MIQTKSSLAGHLSSKGSLQGSINNAVVELQPELEDLTVMPKAEEQHFKSNKYGYDKVTVNGDENLIAENIKKDVLIFGVVGDNEGINTSDATATANDMLVGKTAYVKGQKIEGVILNNGELNYTPNSESQSIPAGFTSGGSIGAVNITTLEDYETCNQLAFEILGLGEMPTSGLLLKLVGSLNDGSSYNSSNTKWVNLVNNSSINITGSSWDDNSLVFNGSNTQFDTGILQSTLTAGYTFIFRIKPTNWNNYRGLFGLHGGSRQGIVGLQYQDGNIVYSNKPDSNANISFSSNLLSINNWHTVVCSYDGRYSYISIDGKNIGTTSNAVTLSGMNNLIVGRAFNSNDRYFKGNMSHAILYNRVLSSSEIYKVMNYINNTINGGVELWQS